MRLSVDVHNFLQNEQIEHEIFLAPEPVKTAHRASALLGLKPQEVAKSIIILVDKKPMNVIIPGDKRLNFRKLKSIFSDSHVKMADTKKTVDSTGYMIGATPPVAFDNGTVKTVIDKELMKLDLIYTGGGELNAVLKIRPEDLKKATKAIVEDVCE